MDFRRIDSSTVECILSEEEMNAYGFQIDDFFSDQEKSRDFLEHIVQMANEEVGCVSKSGLVAMQITKMPNNDLAITLSERDKEDGMQSMLQHIQQMASMLTEQMPEGAFQENSENDFTQGEDSVEDSEQNSDAEMTPQEKKRATEYRKKMEILEKKRQMEERRSLSAAKVYCLNSFSDLEHLALTIDIDKIINSSVYKEPESGEYYLLVKKGRLKLQEYVKLCEKVSEFAMFGSQQQYVEQYCKEHFETVIAKQAINVLKNIQNGI